MKAEIAPFGLVSIVSGMDPASIKDVSQRALLLQFQRDAAVLGPAVAHRRAVLLLNLLGIELTDDFRRPSLHAVKAST